MPAIAIDLVTALVCLLAALRLLLFTRGEARFRPYAALLAYLMTVAFASQAVLLVFGWIHGIGWPQFVLNLAFAGAVFAVRGNVVELYRPASGLPCRLVAILRRESWF
ncbi:phage holin family protein [Laribacter hongkongensis]|uniref:phage holin family protein n=1 Tax=Laribacter hongkongensis TaxID=168471 RepID=UPI001EFE7B01|nr:phage holin family protein [Laribacter hongkongensis]MCG9124302.1 phage holin family protein [Laribacter hongkongensis]